MKKSVLLPVAVLLVVYCLWDGAVLLSNSDIFPRSYQVFLGIAELIQRGVLLKYVVASLFRVSIGFTLAVLIGVPFGLLLGWFRPGVFGVQSTPSDPSADFPHRLDSNRDPVVSRR